MYLQQGHTETDTTLAYGNGSASKEEQLLVKVLILLQLYSWISSLANESKPELCLFACIRSHRLFVGRRVDAQNESWEVNLGEPQSPGRKTTQTLSYLLFSTTVGAKRDVSMEIFLSFSRLLNAIPSFNVSFLISTTKALLNVTSTLWIQMLFLDMRNEKSIFFLNVEGQRRGENEIQRLLGARFHHWRL